MVWIIAMVIVVVIATTVWCYQGRMHGFVADPLDQIAPDIPAEGELTANDLRQARFAVVTRGYAMADVDHLLERLAVQLENNQNAPAPGEAETVGETD